MSLTASPLVRNLSRFGGLAAQDLERLDAAVGKCVATAAAHVDLVREGDCPTAILVVLDGWVSRYKQLRDGHRQIVSLSIAGDICDTSAFVRQRSDYSLGTLTAVKFAEISPEDFGTILTSSPAMAKALWWNEMVSSSIQRAWTTNIGQRPAIARISHLFCEMQVRLQKMDLVQGNGFAFPLTQLDIADATGLTAVHVNRTLRALRRDNLIQLRGKHLTILDPDALRNIATFDPSYLHL